MPCQTPHHIVQRHHLHILINALICVSDRRALVLRASSTTTTIWPGEFVEVTYVAPMLHSHSNYALMRQSANTQVTPMYGHNQHSSTASLQGPHRQPHNVNLEQVSFPQKTSTLGRYYLECYSPFQVYIVAVYNCALLHLGKINSRTYFSDYWFAFFRHIRLV